MGLRGLKAGLVVEFGWVFWLAWVSFGQFVQQIAYPANHK